MDSQSNNADIFLISTNHEYSVYDVLNHVERATGKIAKTTRLGRLSGDIDRMCINFRKAIEGLDYYPKYTLEDGIAMMLSSLKEKSV